MLHRFPQSVGLLIGRFIVTVLVVVFVSAPALAQPKAPDVPENSSTASYLDSLESLKSGTHLIFKDPETGRVVEYPEFPAAWLERAMLQTQTQLYDLQNVSITAEVKGEFVELDVDVRVEIRVPEEWVRVPLEFRDFQLIQPAPEHSVTPPQTGSARFEKNQLPLKSWQFYGKGSHRLQFRLIGQVRPTSNGRQRLRVMAPVANQSRLFLKMRGLIQGAELSTGKPMDVRTVAESQVSEIETWGLSEATEITWTPETKDTEQPTTVQATAAARMKLDLTTEPASLTAQQALAISGGTLEELVVHLPQGFTNAEITATDASGNQIIREADVSPSGAARLSFTAPIMGAITLRYSMELDGDTNDVAIQLPDVVLASNETADLELIVPFGLEVVIQKPDDGSVRQDRVKAATETRGEGVRQAAYRLLSEKARLQLSIREPEAFYSVVPVVNFETEGESVLLTARFSVNVLGGSLNEMTITWPGYEADGWQILDGYTRLVTDTTTTIVASPIDGNSVMMEFPARQSRQFVIEVQALRDLKSFQQSNGLLSLPDIRTPTPHTVTVSLIESDAHSMVLSAPGETAGFPQLPPSRWPEALRQRKAPLTAWLVDAPEKPVQLSVTKQRPEIRTAVLAEVGVVNDTIHVSQILSYNVRHRDVSEVHLRIGDVAPTPTVRLSDTTEPLQQLAVQNNLVTYGLPTAMRGEFELLVDFYWAPPQQAGAPGEQDVDLPLVLPSSAEELIESVRVATNMPQTLMLRRTADWTRIHSDRYSAAWSTTTLPEKLPLTLSYPLRSINSEKPQLLVVKSVLVGDTLITSTTAVFARRPDIAMFSVPAGCEPWKAALGGAAATFDVISSQEESENRIVQIRPTGGLESPSATATLVVRQNLSSSSDLIRHSQARIPRPVNTDRDSNCIWILRQATDSSVFHWAGAMSELTASGEPGTGSADAGSGIASMVEILAPLADASRREIAELLKPALNDSDQHQILVGSVFQRPQTLVLVSRQAMLLATACFGLLIYFAMIKLNPLPLTTTLVLLSAAVTTAFAFAPGPAHALLIRLLPGCVVGTVAAVLHRAFTGRSLSPLQHIDSPDGSTIFTVDEPLPTHIVPDPG